jgi:Holliday junction resolvase RusA-like endonuclease
MKDGPSIYSFELRNLRPCSGNAMYRAVRGGRVVISAEAREFKKTMASLLASLKVPMIRGPVSVHIVFDFQTRHKRDVDNFAKSVLDSLKGELFEDDSDIFDLRLQKNIGTPIDRIQITCQRIVPGNMTQQP